MGGLDWSTTQGRYHCLTSECSAAHCVLYVNGWDFDSGGVLFISCSVG